MQEHFSGQVLRIVEHVLGAEDPADRYFGLIEQVEHALQRQRIDPAINHAIQLVAAIIAPVVAGQCRIVGQVFATDDQHEAFEDRVTIGADLHMLAVGTGVNRRGRDAGHDVAGALADKTEHVELRHHAFHHRENRFVQRHVNDLAKAAVDFAMTQRHQCADHTPQRGNRVADGNPGTHRWPVLETGDIAQTAHGFADRAEARLIFHWPGLAETGQAYHHQFRIQGVQGFPAQAKFFQHAGAEVLDEDVGFAEKFFQDRQAVRVFEVQRQRLFIARLNEPPQRRAFVQFSPFAQGITAVWRLDLDHFGAELAANTRVSVALCIAVIRAPCSEANESRIPLYNCVFKDLGIKVKTISSFEGSKI